MFHHKPNKRSIDGIHALWCHRRQFGSIGAWAVFAAGTLKKDPAGMESTADLEDMSTDEYMYWVDTANVTDGIEAHYEGGVDGIVGGGDEAGPGRQAAAAVGLEEYYFNAPGGGGLLLFCCLDDDHVASHTRRGGDV